MDNQIHLLPFWLTFKRALSDYQRSFRDIWSVALPFILISAVAIFVRLLWGDHGGVIKIVSDIIGFIGNVTAMLVIPAIVIGSVATGSVFDLKTAYIAALKKIPRYIKYSILSVLILIPLTLLFFVPGFYFGFVFSFALYSVYLGSTYHQNPLIDSYLHVRGFFWSIAYRMILFWLIGGLAYMVLIATLAALFVFNGYAFGSIAMIPAITIAVGKIILDAAGFLVITPLFHLFGRALYRDLENARGYTYTDEEKRQASQVVLWAPIISSVIVVALLVVAGGPFIRLLKSKEDAYRKLPVSGIPAQPDNGLNDQIRLK